MLSNSRNAVKLSSVVSGVRFLRDRLDLIPYNVSMLKFEEFTPRADVQMAGIEMESETQEASELIAERPRVKKSWRRYFQFNLRGLFILIAIVAVGASLVVNWIIPSVVQKRAAELIISNGGTIAFAGDELPIQRSPDSDYHYDLTNNAPKSIPWHAHYRRNIDKVYLSKYAGPKEKLYWADLPKLKRIIVDTNSGRNYEANEFFADVGDNYRIQEIEVINLTPVDESLESLAKLENLRRLHLSFSFISNKGMNQLQTLKHLEFLDVVGYKLYREDKPLDFSKIPNVKSMQIRTSTFLDKDVYGIVGMNQLEELDLSETSVTAKELDTLLNMKGLKSLKIHKELHKMLSAEAKSRFENQGIALK